MSEIQVRDRVRLTGEWFEQVGGAATRGEMGTVTRRSGHNSSVLIVAWDGETPYEGVHESWLEVVPPESPEPVSGHPRNSEGMSRGERLANGERMGEYGHPKVSFDRIGAFWSAYLSAPEVDPENLTGEDVGNLMRLLKISRQITDKADDTLDDAEGYIACIRMLRKA